MSEDQRQRILEALAYLEEYRDVRVLVNEDNLVTYGWISTRMELDPDQLRPYKPAMKKSKAKVGASSAAAEGNIVSSSKSTSFGALKRKKAPSSPKKTASSTPTAMLDPISTEEVEVNSSLELLKRKKKKAKTKGSEPAPSKTAPTDPPPSRSKDVLAPPMSAPMGLSFEEVARESLKDTEEVFREEGSSATLNPPVALVEDPFLSVEDFVE